jgi:2-polyprenyl-6-methoxyphenol hydroxylase-like FAD-dependent oxidoreductase
MSGHTDRAVVVGASMAGLVAARVLSETFATVTVVERDHLEDDAEPRRGVPQGRHAHGLLARGREALEELLPGLTDELVGLGAPTLDMQEQFRWVNSGRQLRQAHSGLLGLGVSRPLLESRIRARVRAIPNFDIIDGCDASGLAASAAGDRVTGLRVLDAGEPVLDADLVVDASGRGSRSPQWLTALGYPAPAVEQVHIGLTYASRAYRRDPSGPDGAAVGGTAADPRGGAMLAEEGDRWMVTLAAMLGDTPPLDHEGFTTFAGSLPSPVIHEVIRDAEPLTEAVRFRIPVSSRRRYERLRRFPGGYLVVGDALSHFDPVYGQGMTVAALEALRLRTCLADGTENLARDFFRAAARVVDRAWDISVSADLRFPGVEGRRTPKVRAVNAYLERLHVAGEHDPAIGRAFLRVVNLIDRPERLLAPGVALRVLRGQRAAAAVRGRSATANVTPAAQSVTSPTASQAGTPTPRARTWARTKAPR